MIHLIVDGQKINARPEQTVLEACLQNGIYIPHLCFLEEDRHPVASCRLCFVEIEGVPEPVPACTVNASAGLQITTGAPAVRQLQRTGLKLLLSVHAVDCKNCHAHRACALQTIAEFLRMGLKAKPLETMVQSTEVDQSHPVIDHWPHRCVLCGKCVRVCETHGGLPAFTFCGRGIGTVVRHFPVPDQNLAKCPDCRRCVDICPVGALSIRAS